MSKPAVTHQRLVDIRVQIKEIHEALAGGASGIDLITPLGEVLSALDEVERMIAGERLVALRARIGRKRAPLSAQEERELCAIIRILKPWEPGSSSRRREGEVG